MKEPLAQSTVAVRYGLTIKLKQNVLTKIKPYPYF